MSKKQNFSSENAPKPNRWCLCKRCGLTLQIPMILHKWLKDTEMKVPGKNYILVLFFIATRAV